MAQDFNESTRVMPAAGEPPIDRTMVAAAPPPAGATQMGTTVTCPVCATSNPGLETYCVECGFLLSSTPGVTEDVAVEAEPGGPELIESASGRSFRLRSGVNTVGRENCDILLLDGTVSRRHAEISVENGSVTVTDLGSTNGTQVDGNRLSPNQPAAVQPGALIRFGNATLAYPGPADPDSALAAEATLVTGNPSIDRTLEAASPALAEAGSEEDVQEAPVQSLSSGIARLAGSAGAPDIILTPGTLTIGRRPGNEVVLSDAYVSGRHAEIRCDDDGCTLTDLGSTNGTTVNGVKIEANQPQALVDGDEVQIGQSSFRFETLGSAESEDLAEESASEDAALPSADEGLVE